MPSSRCCPPRLIAHFCAETTFSSEKTSGTSARANKPRRLIPRAEVGGDRHVRRRRHDPAGEVVVAARDLAEDLAEALLRRHHGRRAIGEIRRDRHRRRRVAPPSLALNGVASSAARSLPPAGRALRTVPTPAPAAPSSRPGASPAGRPSINPAWLSLWPRAAGVPLDGVGEEQRRPIVVDPGEGVASRPRSWPPRFDISLASARRPPRAHQRQASWSPAKAEESRAARPRRPGSRGRNRGRSGSRR